MSNFVRSAPQTSERNVGRCEDPGITTCAVSAVSVVLIAQMCRSCTSTTPGSPPRKALTSSGSIPLGTASSIRFEGLRSSATRSRRGS